MGADFNSRSGLSNIPLRQTSTPEAWGIRTVCGEAQPGTTTSRDNFPCRLSLSAAPASYYTGHSLLSNFKHLISGKNSLILPKAKLQIKSLSWDKHSTGQLQELGLQTNMAQQKNAQAQPPLSQVIKNYFYFPLRSFILMQSVILNVKGSKFLETAVIWRFLSVPALHRHGAHGRNLGTAEPSSPGPVLSIPRQCRNSLRAKQSELGTQR